MPIVTRDVWPARLTPHPIIVPRGYKLRAILDDTAGEWLIAWSPTGGGIRTTRVPALSVQVDRAPGVCITCGGGNAVGAWDPREQLTRDHAGTRP